MNSVDQPSDKQKLSFRKFPEVHPNGMVINSVREARVFGCATKNGSEVHKLGEFIIKWGIKKIGKKGLNKQKLGIFS